MLTIPLLNKVLGFIIIGLMLFSGIVSTTIVYKITSHKELTK